MTVTRLEFARALLRYGSFCTGPEYEQGLVAIMTGEDSKARWNPLDTTLSYPGATPFNSFGPAGEYHVWNYPSGLVGVHCSFATMSQANMRDWYQVMRTPGKTAEQLARGFSQTPWGGIGDVLPLEIIQDWNAGKRDYVTDRAAEVAGEGDWPFDAEGTQIHTP